MGELTPGFPFAIKQSENQPKSANENQLKSANNELNDEEKKLAKKKMQTAEHPDFDLIAEKLQISRATTTEQFKSPNVYRAAEHLYAALYCPDEIDGLILPNPKYPDRIPVLKRGLSVSPLEIPRKEEFVERVRRAMVNEVDFGECFGDVARMQLRDVMEKSVQTVIWTDGDAKGVDEHGLPGSKEQLKKLAVAQVYNQMRREIANDRGVHHTEVLSIVAIEGKMKFVPAIVEEFLKKEIGKIFIIEDRVRNLVQAIELIKETASEMEIFPVWIRTGIYKNSIEKGMTLEDCISDFNAIEDISHLASVLEKNNVFGGHKKVGSIFDLDGPLHDDDIRKRLQTRAVIKALMEKGWI